MNLVQVESLARYSVFVTDRHEQKWTFANMKMSRMNIVHSVGSNRELKNK